MTIAQFAEAACFNYRVGTISQIRKGLQNFKTSQNAMNHLKV